MPRARTADPAEPVTLRIPRSVLAAYQARGSDWRELMVDALRADLGGEHVESASAALLPRSHARRSEKTTPAPQEGPRVPFSPGSLVSLPPGARLRS